MSNFNEIINSEKPTLVDFYATWCGPCKMQAPILEQVASEVGDDAKILKVDIDNNMDAARQYGVRSVPTLILFKEGKEVWRQAGVSQKGLLVETINRVI
jgi:thioredoxin 1